MAYIGQSLTEGTRRAYTFVATSGQTTFNAVYGVGAVDVYQNGILLQPSDYNSSSGSSVVLGVGAAVNDEITIIAHNTFSVADTVSSSQGGTFAGNVSMSGTLGVTGAVTASNGLTVDDAGATPLTVDRATDNGDIIDLQKDGTSVGNIAVDSNDNIMFGAKTGGGAGFYLSGSGGTTPFVLPMKENALSDNTVSLGDSSRRYKDIYLGGGAYIGGTGAANYLDDYEEGTFTPSLVGTGTAGVISNGSSYGRYIKIGQMLHFSLHIGCATWSTSPSGYLRIQNMPFTLIGTNGQCAGAVMHNHLNTGGMDLVWYWTNNVTELRMYYCRDNAGWVQQPIYNEAQDYYISGTAMVQ